MRSNRKDRRKISSLASELMLLYVEVAKEEDKASITLTSAPSGCAGAIRMEVDQSSAPCARQATHLST